MDQVLAHGRDDELSSRVGFNLQCPREGTSQAAAQNLENLERGRIVATGLGQHALLGQGEHQPASRHRVVHQALEEWSVSPLPGGTVDLSRRKGRHLFVKQVGRQDGVHQTDAFRLGRGDLASGENHVQGGLEAHQAR